jgi:Na+(H+)/acetate symporter ActP
MISNRSEQFYLRSSKLSTVIWAGLLVLIASLSREVEFVLNAAFSLRGLTSGALLGGLLMAVFWKKGRALPVIVGMLSSLAVMTAIQFFPKWSATKDLWNRVIGVEIFWPWYTLIGAIVTLGIAWLIQRLLAPPLAPSLEVKELLASSTQ